MFVLANRSIWYEEGTRLIGGDGEGLHRLEIRNLGVGIGLTESLGVGDERSDNLMVSLPIISKKQMISIVPR
jgi:hypothetical protein